MPSGSGDHDGDEGQGREVPISEEPESIDFLLPQIPDEVNMDTFLMDWLASDAQAVGQEQEPGQPGFIPSLSSPPWEGFLPSTAGLATPSMPQQSQFAAPAFPPSSQQVQQGGQAAQEVTAGPPTAPSSRPAPGPYSLRPRSAMQREGMRESFGSDSEVSISASDEGELSLSRHSSGKRVGNMLNYANRGMSTSISAVGRGITGTMQAVKGAAVGGASGLASSLPRKRSKDPEVIKAKELARNRRAQKAFRERQKMLQSERSQSMRSLQESVGQLAEENSELKKKIERIEHRPLRGPSQSRLQAQVDPYFGLQQDLSEEEPLTLSVDPDNIIELSAEDVQALTYENLVDIWRNYVDVLSTLLGGARQDPAGAESLQLQGLVKEIARLSQVSCKINAQVWQVFQNSRMTDAEPAPTKAPKAHWHSVLRDMQLSGAQCEEILQERRKAFDNLGAILRQRDSLLQLQVDTLASFTSLTLEDSDVSSGHAKAKQALQRLIDNLRAEQSVVLQSFCCVQQRVFNPIQKAISITQAWPYYPLSLELASALAQQQGAPTAAELLDLRISQPSGAFRTSSASLPPV